MPHCPLSEFLVHTCSRTGSHPAFTNYMLDDQDEDPYQPYEDSGYGKKFCLGHPIYATPLAVTPLTQAGRDDGLMSTPSSDRVMSIGVPKTVVVLKNASRPASMVSSSGTTIDTLSWSGGV